MTLTFDLESFLAFRPDTHIAVRKYRLAAQQTKLWGRELTEIDDSRQVCDPLVRSLNWVLYSLSKIIYL